MTHVLPYLLFLSCPISMGVMMWLMMRPGQRDQPAKPSSSDSRIVQLEREVAELRTAQRDREPVEMQ